ncbi:MAG: YkgJ family cysteine cluster protein, partial [Planctomycetes bacterium]|nr:YkgJ family cysteine cluster protein [Planctomycetota bacterium]
DCVLLHPEGRYCLAYEDRPLQCRTWPWWRENLVSPEIWDYCRGDCPGISKGKSHKVEHIYAEMTRQADEDGEE